MVSSGDKVAHRSSFTPPVLHSGRQNRNRGNCYSEGGRTSGAYSGSDRVWLSNWYRTTSSHLRYDRRGRHRNDSSSPYGESGEETILTVKYMCNVKYAIIISMNEEGNGVNVPQVQNQAPTQSAKPTSAVNAGFDASKIGSGKKHKPEKVKKVKDKKDKETKKTKQLPQNGSRERTKRPVWFWIVLGVLGLAIAGAIIWMVLMLTGFYGDSAPTDLVLESGASNSEDGADNSAVANYVIQLQQVYDNANSEGSAGSTPNNGTSAQEVSRVVEKALKTNQGSSQADSIRLAELAVAYNNSNYERAEEILERINPDKLSIKDQIYYYAIIETVYERNDDNEKAQEAFSAGERLIEQLCKMQECKQ